MRAQGKRQRNRQANRQSGQALVETVLVGAAVATLFALIVFFGKLSDVRWHASIASRNLAFDCAAVVARCNDLATNSSTVDDLRRRHFSDSARNVLSSDFIADDIAVAERKPFWNDRHGKPLLEKASAVSATITPVNFDAWSGALKKLAHSSGAESAGAFIDKIMEVGPDRFGLKLNDGLFKGRVQVHLSPGGPTSFAAQLNRLDLKLGAQTAVLSDEWAASGPGDQPGALSLTETAVAGRVNRGKDIPYLSEYVRLANRPLLEIIKLVDYLGLEPNGSAFRYQVIDMDVVPADRLGQ